jgi:hypothetical protein
VKFNDEQLRTVANLNQYYASWIDAARVVRTLRYRMAWKVRRGRHYLYKIVDSHGRGSSLGPRSVKTEGVLADFLASKNEALEREKGSYASLDATCRMYRSLRLGAIASQAAAILREADLRGLLGTSLIVVGTSAMAAFEVEALSRFALGMDATEDFDLAWAGNTALALKGAAAPVFGMLKGVDPSYTVNLERTFQARNKDAYEVELLLAPSLASSFPRSEPLRPTALPEQEWLLQGTPVDQVVCGRDATPARIVAPDPRWYALQKLWLSDQPKRNPAKRPKDRRQGEVLLATIAAEMFRYPLDDAFEATLPGELKPYLVRWRDAAEASATPARRW